ncbi:hypothetical protein D1BOALGB6SA_6515 [Olavius sp. associated proteobacterium Delta 1]|nr:hypothetical protein D1BOALGB6SA_6515 [Olavius sp. associated proteobacterium Delta 1]
MNLAINAVGEELQSSADYCRTEGIGIEITDFAFPWNLDSDQQELIDKHIRAVEGIQPIVTHGPFFELNVVSFDMAIKDVCRQRHRVSLDAAKKIGADIYVAHTNFNPMIRQPSYRAKFASRLLDFWLPFADDAAINNIVIVFENNWENSPEIHAEIVSKANHKSLKASFDNGHALVFSGVCAADWIKMLGTDLNHCHLHDNFGELDQHNPIGTGKEDWTKLINALRNHAPNALLVVESDSLEKNKIGLDKLRSFLKTN